MAMSGHNSESSKRRQLSLLREADRQLEIFRRFVETSGQAFGMADLEGRIFFVNSILFHMLGEKSREDVYQHHLFDYYTPETVKRIQDEILPLVRQQGQWVGELTLIDKQQHATPTISNIFLLRDYTDKPLCFTTVVTDISERVRMENELRSYRDHLEQLVSRRTAELEKSNTLLQIEIAERKQIEKEHARLTAILESTSDLVATATPDGRLLYMNAAGRRMLEWDADEDIRGHNLCEAHAESDARIVQEEGIPTARSHGIWQGETAIMNRSGTKIPVSQVIMTHQSAHGKIEYMSTIMRDIKERIRAEQALRESETHIREVIDNAPFGAHTYALEDDGRLIFLGGNPSADRILNLNHSALIGMKIEEAFPLLETEISEQYRVVARTGQRWVKDVVRYDEETRISGAFAVFAFQTGPHRVTAFFYDITERKRAEQALRNNMEILAEAERIGHMGSWQRNLTTIDITWSAEIRRILGFQENEKISFKQFKSRIHPDDRDVLAGKWQESTEKGTPFIEEFRIILPSGIIRHVVGRAEASLDPQGKPVLVHGTIQDITEMKRLEDDLIKAQKLESIGTLAGGLAHDYNNLLTTIIGNMELAKMDMAKTDPAYKPLTKAEKAAMSARDLTQQIITFSRGGYPMSKIMPIQDLITQSIRLALSGSGIKSEWKIADDLPDVKVDENQIRQVIHNIVINAREAMPQGGTLFVEADQAFLGYDNVKRLTEGIYVRLVFRDEGWGICAEHIPRVFDPYFTTKDMGSIKGMGLGLSICYSIITRHGGHIQLDSKEGKGTTVTIYLPAAAVQKVI